jgi:putative chitinase
MPVKLTVEIVKAGTGCADAVATQWLAPLQKACDKFQINTAQRVAAFLANVGVESRGLSALVESLNYTAPRLAVVWPSRYAENPHADTKVPNSLAYELAGHPVQLANNVYGGRMGNGPESSGDGWRFRGQGPIQMTGRANITACGLAISVDLATDPSPLQQPDVGALSAAWFFSKIGCNELADSGDFAATVKRVNGAPPSAANQGPLRQSRNNAVLALLAPAKK